MKNPREQIAKNRETPQKISVLLHCYSSSQQAQKYLYENDYYY
jgi:Tat protein secretion system quality control protein TatD with DNase activity